MRSIASRQRTADVRLRSSIFRAPRLWIFLSSLQEAFFSSLLVFSPEVAKEVVPFYRLVYRLAVNTGMRKFLEISRMRFIDALACIIYT